MATAYTEFDCLGTDLMTNLTSAILASGDWSRPNSGSLPTLFTATTTRGAQMALDLNTTAFTVSLINATFYRSHDGTTAVDGVTRFLRHKTGATGSLAANTYHGIVSAGKEHLFISVEGPRIGEANPDSATVGSNRMYFFMSDLVPYFPADTTPTIVSFGATANAAGATWLTHGMAWAHRNGANTTSWQPGKVISLDWPNGNSASLHLNSRLEASLDGDDQQHWPYLYVDNTEGLRGRLSSFFYLGYNYATTLDVPVPQEGQIVTIDGLQYKALAVHKGDANVNTYGAFGGAVTSTSVTYWVSPIIAVPYA